jgi:hypothetical protein
MKNKQYHVVYQYEIKQRKGYIQGLGSCGHAASFDVLTKKGLIELKESIEREGNFSNVVIINVIPLND